MEIQVELPHVPIDIGVVVCIASVVVIVMSAFVAIGSGDGDGGSFIVGLGMIGMAVGVGFWGYAQYDDAVDQKYGEALAAASMKAWPAELDGKRTVGPLTLTGATSDHTVKRTDGPDCTLTVTAGPDDKSRNVYLNCGGGYLPPADSR